MADWQVIKNPIGPDEYIYQVIRQIRENEPLHSGNMEHAGVYDTEAEAEAKAAELNRR